MENFRKCQFDFDYDAKNDLDITQIKQLEKYINQMNKLFDKGNQNFVDLIICIRKIKDLFKGYYSYWVYDKKRNMLRFQDIMNNFGLDETQVSRLLACYDKYLCFDSSEEKTGKLIDIFKDFSKSKLFELLPVDSDQLTRDIKNNVVTPNSSVGQIRQYVKNYKAQQKANGKLNEESQIDKPDIVEEEIPMAYNPKQEYEFTYFETKTKSQLLNMIWDLQKEYQKLKKEKNKK